MKKSGPVWRNKTKGVSGGDWKPTIGGKRERKKGQVSQHYNRLNFGPQIKDASVFECGTNIVQERKSDMSRVDGGQPVVWTCGQTACEQAAR
jgi:hypothetical protein